MSLSWLDPVAAEPLEDHVVALGQAHPMRTVTHAAAAEVGAWSGDTPRQVQATFDRLADEWHTRHTPQRLDSLGDALVRGGPLPRQGTWLELGAGDGWASAYLAQRAPRLVAMDLSGRMLRASPDDGVGRFQADADALPLDDHAITVAILMNMLLFPTELDRVIAPGGRLVWVSSRGPATPIYLAPEQVVAAMPGRWGGTAGQHGTATWAVLRRLG